MYGKVKQDAAVIRWVQLEADVQLYTAAAVPACDSANGGVDAAAAAEAAPQSSPAEGA